jgi:hypothetical protein
MSDHQLSKPVGPVVIPYKDKHKQGGLVLDNEEREMSREVMRLTEISIQLINKRRIANTAILLKKIQQLLLCEI